MVKAATKPAPTAKPSVLKAVVGKQAGNGNRPIRWPDLLVNKVKITDVDLVIDEKRAKGILGWETETEYGERLKASDPKMRAAKLSYGEEYLLELDGEKVRCANNARNRPFDETHSRKLGQDILAGHWRFNCETIIVSKHGDVDSGQHRLIALVIACAEWRKNPHGYPAWPDSPPTIRSLIVFGADDSPETLRTLDNVKPRSLMDVFYTSPLFAKLGMAERKECSRMMDFAVDLLWRRLDVGATGGNRYQTHSASIEFADAHPTLKKAIRHVFDCNSSESGRGISSLKVSAGHLAALVYLMSCSGSDAETYHAACPKQEKGLLEFSLWEKAESFASKLAAVERVEDDEGQFIRFDGVFAPVADALAALVDTDEAGKGRTIEKLAVIAKAWHAWNENGEVTADNLDISENYQQTDSGWRFVDEPTIGGIDKGSGAAGADGKGQDKAEVERRKEEARQAKIAALDVKARAKADKATSAADAGAAKVAATLTAQFAAMRAQAPGHIIIVRSQMGNHAAWMDDATPVAEAAGVTVQTQPASGLPVVFFAAKDFEVVVGKLIASGRQVATAVQKEGSTQEFVVTPHDPIPPATPVKSPTPKAKPVGTPPKPALRGGTGNTTAPVPSPKPSKK
jgi:hypothetical protein